ncbi:MAG: glycosyltransferase [Verrucomicrobia bacterium]|nr:glycosyltransferase [Verrucomicrobiota bacterium]
MKPRVLFLSPQPFFQWRGSPIRVNYNLQALSDLGYDIDLLTLPFGEDRDISNVTLHRVGPLPGVSDLPIGPSLPKLLFDFKLYCAARKLMRTHQYAVVHGVEDAGFLGVFLARKQKARIVYEKHSDPQSYRKGFIRNLIMSLYAKVEAFTIRRADAVIATGNGLAESVRALCPATPCHPICDIPSSRSEADPEAVQTLRAQLQQNETDVLATYVGSFAVYQGIDLLFEAIPAALRSAPCLRVLIIGGSDSEIEARKQDLQTQGVTDAVTFLGKIQPDALPAYLAASDILLSPRISGHNTPLKLLDYFKAGGSILATDVQANRLLLDDTTALFAAPEAPAFAQALAGLANDPARRQSLAAKGRHLIETTYNFDAYRTQLAKVYDLILSKDTSS